MLRRPGLPLLIFFTLFCLGAQTSQERTSRARTLTFQQRVQAQRAIERVAYAHQIGAKVPFDQAMPDAVLEKKVRLVLRQSSELERVWRRPITAEALRREMARIERDTRLPERLREIYAALGNDRFLIQETLVRASLAGRLMRGFQTGGQPTGPQRGDDWLRETATDFDPGSVPAVASPDESPKTEGAPSETICVADDTWDNGILDDHPGIWREHTGVWTGTHLIVWNGRGFSYNPLIDNWTPISSTNAPQEREHHSAVWTGQEMIVWGGSPFSPVNTLNTGGRYNPASDTWAPTSTNDAPAARASHSAVWANGSMIVWGGRGSGSAGRDDGGRYDPATDSWGPINANDAPAGRASHSAVWTGMEMIVWGGLVAASPGDLFDSGGRYNPATDTWTATSMTDAPTARVGHSAVWTGSEMIVWGGAPEDGESFGAKQSGGRYRPDTDTWSPTSLGGAPEPRQGHGAVWTGSRMIVWGGAEHACCDFSLTYHDGSLYDPATDTWTLMSEDNAPGDRESPIAVWTGDRLVVWGGSLRFNTIFGGTTIPRDTGAQYEPLSDTWTPTSQGRPMVTSGRAAVWTGNLMVDWAGTDSGEGGRYDPVLDVWSPISAAGAPYDRTGHTGVWTGSELIVWGGISPEGVRLSDGGLYDPAADTWRPVLLGGVPMPRTGHTAIWNGNAMIVWGGQTSAGRTNTGGSYDLGTSSWTPLSLTDAPSPRIGHTAVWANGAMIVFGGHPQTINPPFQFNTGGLYHPTTDSWTATPTAGVPPRTNHTAVWTGDEMIVWGGSSGFPSVGFDKNTGGRFDPVSNTWSAVNEVGAPSARSLHSAVWTGQKMVVWGSATDGSGGRYDPETDSWLPTSLERAPVGRNSHAAVWTGSRMIVWGGSRGQRFTGGRYGLDQSPDADEDGVTTCSGDCDDARPLVFPGAPQVCDGRNNDCSHASYPGLAGTNEADDDGDLSTECQGDCDDVDPGIHPGAPDLPGNALDENCDGVKSCDPAAAWQNRGLLQQCVARECTALMRAGLVTPQECQDLIRRAGQIQLKGSMPSGDEDPTERVQP